ncbi:hypothetical protein EVAR_3718_1 [Eumeta japonica]|uniref:Uncharacterized protein n=1 Tax=Eumeta variegata TaxID=151549 RepID=A0A4C1SSA1_EUMVA|nr:hypothetical protein EVAR_3718_1 [Eumeta japonica]
MMTSKGLACILKYRASRLIRLELKIIDQFHQIRSHYLQFESILTFGVITAKRVAPSSRHILCPVRLGMAISAGSVWSKETVPVTKASFGMPIGIIQLTLCNDMELFINAIGFVGISLRDDSHLAGARFRWDVLARDPPEIKARSFGWSLTAPMSSLNLCISCRKAGALGGSHAWPQQTEYE